MSLIIDLFNNELCLLGLSDLGKTEIKNIRNKYQFLVEENIKIYNDKLIQEIYPDNDWIQINNDKNSNVNFSYIYLNNLELYLTTFKCLKTNSFGYTFRYGDNQFLHPFHIVKHEFKLIDVDLRFTNYKCDRCGILGQKTKGIKNGAIRVEPKNLIYSCDDMIIKNIIE